MVNYYECKWYRHIWTKTLLSNRLSVTMYKKKFQASDASKWNMPWFLNVEHFHFYIDLRRCSIKIDAELNYLHAFHVS